MKIAEIITESKKKSGETRPEREPARAKGRMNPDHEAVMKTVHKSRDPGGIDRAYHGMRMGMALACADGLSINAVDMDGTSWIDKFNTLHPYTEQEENMVFQALATIPSEHQQVSAKSRSEEPGYVYKDSPIEGFKGYPR